MLTGEKKLGFGAMRFPLTDPEDGASVDMEKTAAMVDKFLARGFRYVDTAYMYHKYESENILRKVLVERHPRQAFLLADKMPTVLLKEKQDLPRIFEEQLHKCGVEYFDFYLMHNINAEDYPVAKALGAFEFCLQKKAEGRIRHFGFSYHADAELLDRILTENPQVEFVQLQINYLDWDSESIQSRANYEVVRRHGKTVLIMEPVKGGTLATLPPRAAERLEACAPGRSPASWALRFAANLEGVGMVLSGMSSDLQVEENLALFEDMPALSPEEMQALWETRDLLTKDIAIACTACAYCTTECPVQLPIPQYFDLYNRQQQFGGGRFHGPTYYKNLQMNGAKPASACLGCKRCEKMCPQRLPIAQWMKTVSETFD